MGNIMATTLESQEMTIENQRRAIRLLSEKLVNQTKTNRRLLKQLMEAHTKLLRETHVKDNYHTDQFLNHVKGMRMHLHQMEQLCRWTDQTLGVALGHLKESADKIDFGRVR